MAKIGQFVASLWSDTSGVILPYVTLLLGVIVGLAVLALDGGRYMSLQTQLQQGADAFALAAAGELDHRTDSIVRANAAINNFFTAKPDSQNSTWFGSGSSQYVAVSNVRYLSSLPDDAYPITNANVLCSWTDCTTDNALHATYVEVTVQPVSLPTILPASFFGGVNTITSGAQAVAGFPHQTICDIPPVFICNPYETSGMSDGEATDALRTNLSNPAITRRQLRMTATNTSPGHFGYLIPPDGCTGSSCLEDWIARARPKACYTSATVDLNTGAKSSVTDGFNVRFDIYNGNLNKYVGNSDYAPAINVRKSYVAPIPSGNKSVDWCTGNGGGAHPAPATDATYDTNAGCNGSLPSCNDASNPASARGLPLDGAGDPSAWTGLCSGGTCIMGNGDWNCLNYWTNNHTAAAPAGCTSSNPTVSRYEVYRYEIANGLVGDWSGNRLANTGKNPTGNGESGAPYCAGTGVDTTTGATDRRVIYAVVINCLAQSAKITGGSTANDIPVAGFGKFFMTQPVNADSSNNGYLYGEMTGLVGRIDKVRIIDEVQLYR
jgi:Flp pilus assembly protein TadG